jgi:hypothetical protein
MTQSNCSVCALCQTKDLHRLRQGSRGLCSRCYYASRLTKTCQVTGCSKPTAGKYCQSHTRNLRLYSVLEPVRFSKLTYCSMAECYEGVYAHGRCAKHDRHSKTNERPLQIVCQLCTGLTKVKPTGVVPKHCKNCRSYLDHIQRRYGISVEDYLALANAQNWACAICQTSSATLQRTRQQRLVVDHCHTTGLVRGLLCQRCNTALGMFEEDLVSIVMASVYLQRTAKPLTPYTPAE